MQGTHCQREGSWEHTGSEECWEHLRMEDPRNTLRESCFLSDHQGLVLPIHRALTEKFKCEKGSPEIFNA